MDIKQLNYFKNIIEKGGVSAAARSLNVAQPVLSRALQALESELGETLLIRKKSGIELTVQGSVFYQKIKKLIAMYSDIQRNPFDQVQSKSSLINYARTKYWTSWPLRAFHDAVHESDGLEIQESIVVKADEGIEALLDEGVDIFLTHDKKWNHDGLELLFQREFKWGLYLNGKIKKSEDPIDLQKMSCLAWADKDEFLFHQIQTNYPQLNVKYIDGYEDLINQKKITDALIIPDGLKLSPADFFLHEPLKIELNLLLYVKKERYAPSMLSALKKGLEARW